MRCPTCGFVSYDDQRICARCGDDLGAAPKNPDKPIPPHAEYHFVEADSSLNPQPDLADTMEKIRESLEEIEGIESGSTSSREIESTVIVQPEVRSLEKGGFWIRLLAFAIDNVIIYLVSFLLLFVGALAVGINYSPEEGGYLEKLGEVIPFPYFVGIIILTMTYYTYFIGASGQTIGKLVCHLKVVQTSGEPLSYGQAFLRWVGYLVSSIVLYLGFFWVMVDYNRQGWHDKIADTYVIKV